MAKKQESEYVCSKEAEIAQISTTMKAIAKVVFGNGKDGLNLSVPLLSQTVNELRKDMKEDRQIRISMMTSLSAVVKTQDDEYLKKAIKEDVYDKREKKRNKKLNIFLVVITVIAIVVPTMITIFSK